jgi:hypothetical protein
LGPGINALATRVTASADVKLARVVLYQVYRLLLRLVLLCVEEPRQHRTIELELAVVPGQGAVAVCIGWRGGSKYNLQKEWEGCLTRPLSLATE